MLNACPPNPHLSSPCLLPPKVRLTLSRTVPYSREEPSCAKPSTRPKLLLGTARSRGVNLRLGGAAAACAGACPAAAAAGAAGAAGAAPAAAACVCAATAAAAGCASCSNRVTPCSP